jgi:squalene-associated FAD-dependent desaturase
VGHVAIIGGGLAGISAAWYLIKAGLRVTIFEARHRLGGRVRSFYERQMGSEVNTCQHIALGCCTEFLRFCREVGILSYWERHRTLYFVDYEGQVHRFCPSRWLFPPLHLLPAVARLGFLTLRERVNLLKGMYRLSRGKGLDSRATMGEWLPRNRQTPALIERFWEPILVSALSEKIEDIPVAAARKVLVDGLMATRHGYELWAPNIPLSDLFDGMISPRLEEAGIILAKGRIVRRISRDETGWVIDLADGGPLTFDGIVLAVPWRTAIKVLSPEFHAKVLPGWAERLEDPHTRAESCAITAVHLWFDQACFSWPHAVLLGRSSQWVFCPSFTRANDARSQTVDRDRLPIKTYPDAWYCQVVVSASHGMPKMTAQEWIRLTVDDLKAVFPAARGATLIHGRVVTEPAAVLSPTWEWNQLRPSQVTPLAGLVLAGDWTATDWPGTMESAVRSGIAAAETMASQFQLKNRL